MESASRDDTSGSKLRADQMSPADARPFTPSPRRLRLDCSFALIQQIRLAHALAESAFEITVPDAELDKFSVLRDRFGLRLAAARGGDVPIADALAIDHRTPATAVGRVVRPLIFPRAIVEHCRTLWPASRPHRYSFAGLLTDSRRALLERWMGAATTGSGAGLGVDTGLVGFLRRQLIRWRGADRQRRIGDLTLWSSERGRRFPTKAWDADYFRMLARSQFVLCPSGDYRWSYRFFEACLCGAVPIVEEPSPLYDGFRYRLMSDARGGEPWPAGDAEHNFRTCAERIVVPASELNRELTRLVAAASAGVSAAPARSAPPPS
jgi:hypothetical protein